MPDRTVRCPRCGATVDVPTTGEKVRCACGQKFRFDTANGDAGGEQAEAPLIFDLADDGQGGQPPVNEVRCPRCDRMVTVPASGEKVRCACGQKFRFDVPAPEPGAVEPEPEEPPANEVRCPRCGSMVRVPTTGEKVRCGECGQKFRFDVPDEERPPEDGGEEPLVLESEAGREPPTSEVSCPQCGELVAVPTTGEKVRCPGCGQKFRFAQPPPTEEAEEGPEALPSPGPLADALPSPVAPQAEAAVPGPLAGMMAGAPGEADELRDLWPLLCQFITQIYEEGEATDADRRLFRSQANRAVELARRLLPQPDPEDEEGHHVLTVVVGETTLDEVVALSLEDFRHLRESLDAAQALLDRHLPRPEPELPPATGEPARPAVRREPRSRGVAAALIGMVALLVLAVGVVAAALIVRERLRAPGGRERSWAEILGVEQPHTSGPRTSTTVAVPRPVRPGTDLAPPVGPATDLTAVVTPPEPTFPRPAPSTGTVGPHVVRPKPATDVPMIRVHSRWKAGPDGTVSLFDRRSLDGWMGNPERWEVRDGVLYGIMAVGSSTITAQEAEWTDYTLGVEAKLGKAGTLVLHHGPLVATIGSSMARLGYAGQGGRVLDEVGKGATRNKWYRFELDAHGPKAELRVDGKVVLSTAGHTPQAGAPALEVQSGGVAVRGVRLRLHPSDPAYRAVALAEGWLVAARPTTDPGEPPTPRRLPPGRHTLFNGRNLDGWTPRGDWTVRNGALLSRAPMGDVAVLSTGSDAWRDYSFRARATLTRRSRMAREGEYFLLIVRYQDDRNFFCIRFAIEGIYELGYYHNGRWRETSRARHGLGTDFNKWHDFQVTVRGDQVSLVIDGIGGKPPWPIPRRYRSGGVALGVTGGEAAFDDVSIHLPR